MGNLCGSGTEPGAQAELGGSASKRCASHESWAKAISVVSKEVLSLNSDPDSLAKKYAVLKELGTGGYGSLFLCKQLDNNTLCVHKRVTLDKEERNRKEFLSYLAVTRRLSRHASMLKVLALYGAQNQYTLVTQHCAGGPLGSLIVKQGLLSEAEVQNVVRQLLHFLAFCHKKDIVHCDIRLENLFLGSSDKHAPLVVGGWSSAAFCPEGETVKEFSGCIEQLAPEVLDNGYSKKADIWGVGILLCYLLTGSLPFPPSSSQDIPQSNLGTELDFSTDRWLSVNESARDFVQQLLTKDPRTRPTANELLKHPWLKGAGVVSKPPDEARRFAVLIWQRCWVCTCTLKRLVVWLAAHVVNNPCITKLVERCQTRPQGGCAGVPDAVCLSQVLQAQDVPLTPSRAQALLDAAAKVQGGVRTEVMIAAMLVSQRLTTVLKPRDGKSSSEVNGVDLAPRAQSPFGQGPGTSVMGVVGVSNVVAVLPEPMREIATAMLTEYDPEWSLDRKDYLKALAPLTLMVMLNSHNTRRLMQQANCQPCSWLIDPSSQPSAPKPMAFNPPTACVPVLGTPKLDLQPHQMASGYNSSATEENVENESTSSLSQALPPGIERSSINTAGFERKGFGSTLSMVSERSSTATRAMGFGSRTSVDPEYYINHTSSSLNGIGGSNVLVTSELHNVLSQALASSGLLVTTAEGVAEEGAEPESTEHAVVEDEGVVMVEAIPGSSLQEGKSN